MRRRYTAIERAHLLALSIFMDPRIKKIAFSDRDASWQAEQWIIQDAQDLTQAVAPAGPQKDDRQSHDEQNPSGLWDHFEKVVHSQQTRSSASKAIILEVKAYLGEDVLPRIDKPLERKAF
jgi:hypothetical protein